MQVAVASIPFVGRVAVAVCMDERPGSGHAQHSAQEYQHHPEYDRSDRFGGFWHRRRSEEQVRNPDPDEYQQYVAGGETAADERRAFRFTCVARQRGDPGGVIRFDAVCHAEDAGGEQDGRRYRLHRFPPSVASLAPMSVRRDRPFLDPGRDGFAFRVSTIDARRSAALPFVRFESFPFT